MQDGVHADTRVASHALKQGWVITLPAPTKFLLGIIGACRTRTHVFD